MGEYGKAEVEKALKALASMAERSAKAQQKFAPGTAQHTLQQNRIHALHVAAALLGGRLSGQAPALAKEELERAQAPIASLISKSGKAQTKLPPASWQYAMLADNLRALRLAAPLLEAALNQKEAER